MEQEIKQVVNDRITVVESVYFQELNEQPQLIESRYTRELQSQEQVYQRRVLATEEWQPLDTGWIDNVGMIVIQNNVGIFSPVLPTEEEREEAVKKILRIAFLSALYPIDSSQGMPEPEDFWIIPPKESYRATPSDASNLMIRSECGEFKYNLVVYPK